MTTIADRRKSVEAAHVIAAAGFPVIEVSTKKIPTTKSWPARATTDRAEIEKRWLSSRLRLLVGYTLAGHVAIDIDTVEGHGADSDGPTTWTTLTAGRSVPPTWTVKTPTGGLHYVFRIPATMKITSKAGALGKGLDVKSGRAAYLVGPGSSTSRGTYTLVDDSPPAEVPQWLLDELRYAGLVKGEKSDRPDVRQPTAPPSPWEPLGAIGQPIPVGQREDTIFRYASSLRARRLSRAEAHVLASTRLQDCRSSTADPFTTDDVGRILDSVWSRYPSGSTEAASAATGTATRRRPEPDPVMFYGVLGDMVRTAEPHTEADPVGILASLLAGAGAFLGPSAYLEIGAVRHPLLIWPLLFGRTSSGRKGETTTTAKLFLLSSYAEGADMMASGLSSGEGLIERIRDQAGEDDKGGREDKRLLVTESEFSSVMARARREGNTLSHVLRDAWEGQAMSVLNRSALKASSSHIAVVGHITPTEFRMRLAEADMAGGTYNRFLPIFVQRSKQLALPEPIPASKIERASAPLRKTIDKRLEYGRVVLSPAARRHWADEVYAELTTDDEDDTTAAEFTRRAAPYALRIAALHAVVNGSTVLDVEHLGAAVALVRYSMESAAHVLDRRHVDHRLDRIREALDRAGEDGLSLTDVSGLFSRNLSAAARNELLEQLVATGNYTKFGESTKGRGATRYRAV